MHHNAVADDARSRGVQHAGRKQVELERLVSHHYRVTRVRPAGDAGADVVVLGQDIHLQSANIKLVPVLRNI